MTKEQRQKYYQEHKDKYRYNVAERQAYQLANQEKIREQKRIWYQKNKRIESITGRKCLICGKNIDNLDLRRKYCLDGCKKRRKKPVKKEITERAWNCIRYDMCLNTFSHKNCEFSCENCQNKKILDSKLLFM